VETHGLKIRMPEWSRSPEPRPPQAGSWCSRPPTATECEVDLARNDQVVQSGSDLGYRNSHWSLTHAPLTETSPCEGLRPRRAVGTLALSRSAMSPSVGIKTSAPGIYGLSRLNGWPMRSPADASPAPSRAQTHGLGPMWIATPSSRRTRTDYSLPISRRTIPSAPTRKSAQIACCRSPQSRSWRWEDSSRSHCARDGHQFESGNERSFRGSRYRRQFRELAPPG